MAWLKCLLPAAAALCLCTAVLCPVHAQEVSFDREQKRICIKAEATGGRKVYSLTVLPAAKTPENLTTDEVNKNGQILYKTFVTAPSGEIDDSILLPQDFAYGRYVAYFSGDGLDVQLPFAVIDQTRLAELLDRFNAEDAAGIAQLLADHGQALGLCDGPLRDGGEISGILENARPVSGYTCGGFIDQFLVAEGAVGLKAGRMTTEEFLKNYAGYLGEGAYAAYCAEPQRIQEKIDGLIKQMTFCCSDFEEDFEQTVFCGRMMGAASPNEMRKCLEQYYTDNQYSLGDYIALNEYEKATVFSGMYKLRDRMITVNYVKTAFGNICKEVMADRSDGGSSKPGSGNSGGSGGTSGGIVPGGTEIVGGENRPQQGEESSADKTVFPDMKDHWAAGLVYSLYERGIINGYEDGRFLPENQVTRAEFIKMTTEAFGIAQEKDDVFEDVSAEDWFAGYVYGAYRAGIAQGFDGRFAPYSDITRQDAAVILARALNFAGVSLERGTAPYVDAEDIAGYAREAVEGMSAAGIVTGDANSFRPLDTTTRAEAAALISRALAYGE